MTPTQPQNKTIFRIRPESKFEAVRPLTFSTVNKKAKKILNHTVPFFKPRNMKPVSPLQREIIIFRIVDDIQLLRLIIVVSYVSQVSVLR